MTGLSLFTNFRKKSANPKIAKNHSPMGSKAALAKKAAISIFTI